jgi:two-component system response regulator RegA
VKESGPRQVLVADADRLTCQALSVGLAGLGLDVRQCTSVREARAQLDDGWPELLVLELRLADGPSLGLLSWVRTACFDVRVVVVTGHSSVASAVRCTRLGTLGYFKKPARAADVLAAARCGVVPCDLPPPQPCSLDQAVWEYINRIANTSGSITRGAELLGIDRRSLRRMLSKHAP